MWKRKEVGSRNLITRNLGSTILVWELVWARAISIPAIPIECQPGIGKLGRKTEDESLNQLGKGKGGKGYKGKGKGKSQGKGGYQTPFYGTCRNCGVYGHSAGNCPELGKGFSGVCYICNRKGHPAKLCPAGKGKGGKDGKGKGGKGINEMTGEEEPWNWGGEPAQEPNTDEQGEEGKQELLEEGEEAGCVGFLYETREPEIKVTPPPPIPPMEDQEGFIRVVSKKQKQGQRKSNMICGGA